MPTLKTLTIKNFPRKLKILKNIYSSKELSLKSFRGKLFITLQRQICAATKNSYLIKYLPINHRWHLINHRQAEKLWRKKDKMQKQKENKWHQVFSSFIIVKVHRTRKEKLIHKFSLNIHANRYRCSFANVWWKTPFLLMIIKTFCYINTFVYLSFNLPNG